MDQMSLVMTVEAHQHNIATIMLRQALYTYSQYALACLCTHMHTVCQCCISSSRCYIAEEFIVPQRQQQLLSDTCPTACNLMTPLT